MRYLILSDIHANLTALDAALNAARGQWQKAVCLGDLVGYGPDPNEVIERVRGLNAVTIRGNHDKAIAGVVNDEDFNPVARNAVLWSRGQLHPENLAYLQELPQGPVKVDSFSICHGSLRDEDEYVFSPDLALDGLQNCSTLLSFFGHTHIQGGFTLRDGDLGVLRLKPGDGKYFASLATEPGASYLLNPGSIGQPRDEDPRAAFAIADMGNRSVEFWRVPYDIADVQDRMARARLPEPLIMRLSIGR